jgi:uncharacterized phosphosugar-binding protein
LEKIMPLMGIYSYWNAIENLQRDIVETQAPMLEAIANQMITAIDNKNRLFLFGTGHSHILAEEAHFRAGGLAAFIPILFSGVMIHEGARLSGKLERTPGLAEPILNEYAPQAGDMLFVFSNSGVNQMPVEMAVVAREKGMVVVSISSLNYAQVAPVNSIGKRLHEVADYAIDNRILPGDALVELTGLPWRAGPASTLIGSFIINSLVAEVAYRMTEQQKVAPIFASANMPGAAQHNEALLKTWGAANPHL